MTLLSVRDLTVRIGEVIAPVGADVAVVEIVVRLRHLSVKEESALAQGIGILPNIGAEA